MTHRDEIIRHWAINDGRTRVGSVDLSGDGAYVARDLAGKVVGRFKDLPGAAAAFDQQREHHE
jgi:hypothetical protein